MITVQQKQLQLLEQDVSHIYCTRFYSVYIVLPPSSVSVIPVEDIYTIGDTVTLTCTVIANVPDPRNNAFIIWRDSIGPIRSTTTPVNNVHINYTYPLTINSISLSDADQYSCGSRIHGVIANVMNSDTITNYTIVNVKCKYIPLID